VPVAVCINVAVAPIAVMVYMRSPTDTI